MTRGYSIYLDAVRVFAALVVLASHVGLYWVSGGSLQWIRDLNLGSDFVIVFFVLSGLVIAHTSAVKDKSLRNFATARLWRLYSVAIPAIALSFVAWAVVASYPGSKPEPLDALAQLFAALTFTNYAWISETRLPVNGPYWSVAYEFWYYALFGAWMFLKGRLRFCVLAGLVMIIGVQVLLLLPCWLLGVYVYRHVSRPESPQKNWHVTSNSQADPNSQSGSASKLTEQEAWIWTLAPLAIYALCLSASVPLVLQSLTSQALGGTHPALTLHFSDEFIWNTVIAGLVAVHFMGAAQLIAERTPGEGVTRVVRWWSARSFSLYLFHMPIMQMIARHPAYEATNPWHISGCAVAVVIACLLLAEVTERRLGWMRAQAARLRKALTNRAAQASTPAPLR